MDIPMLSLDARAGLGRLRLRKIIGSVDIAVESGP